MAAGNRRRGKSNRRGSDPAAQARGFTDAPPPDAAQVSTEAEESEAAQLFPIVGVGASAGGLGAFTQLLRALPVDTGMAYVLVQHLAPGHDSALAEILSRATSMPVSEVESDQAVEVNHVYVIPPDRNMVIDSGHLTLLPREARGKQHPIDQFFRSLAASRGHLSIGVVLSGTATDGTHGLEAIKAEGGITFAQDGTATHSGMPQSAIGSGSVDFVLPPEGIAEELARIAAHPLVAVPPKGADAESPDEDDSEDGQALLTILRLLHSATGVDFAQYKKRSLYRRIRRRMVLLEKKKLGDFALRLAGDPAEVKALYQDILINVTSFFRDPETFEALEANVIPALLDGRSRHDPLRAWVVGCSTGDEAYSVAMVIAEALESANSPTQPQIFATDLNAACIEKARAGVYSKDHLLNVSSERLSRFFVEQDGQFRVAKHLRDMCVFSQHNVLSDPPFSRMDLVCCRNLLIYLGTPLQQRLISVLHYALKPTGYLVLGASETVGHFRELFEVHDARNKIFAKKPGAGRLLLMPSSRIQSDAPSESAPRARGPKPPEGAAARTALTPRAVDIQREADRLLLSFAPPAVLVDRNLEILQFRGNTEPYLVPAEGKATLSLLKMAREGLVMPLRSLLHKAIKDDAPVREEGVRLGGGAQSREFDIDVVPVRGEGQEGCFLVLFEEASPPAGGRKRAATRKPKPGSKDPDGASIARLEHELASTREYLQALIEQHDSALEDLQEANEEAQSANEELQSLNEELETSKEEIESSNEELTTLNEELHIRNVELGRTSGDLINLITSVQVAMVIVGRDLRIRRLSPMAERLLNVIPADVGRPITDIRLKFELAELDALLQEAIDTVSSMEREVRGQDGNWYSLRIRPYMTLDDEVDGAVLMLLDVDALRRGREYAENVIASMRDPLLVLSTELRVRNANRSYYETFAARAEDTEGRHLYELGNGSWDIPELRRVLDGLLSNDATVEDFVVEHDFARLGRRVMRLNARKLVAPGEGRQSILLAIEDVTALHDSRAELRHSEQRYRRLFEAAMDGVLVIDPETRLIVDANPFMEQLLGLAHDDLMGRQLFEIGLFGDPVACAALFDELEEKGVVRCEDLTIATKAGEWLEVEVVSNLYQQNGERAIQCHVRNVSQRKRSERALRASEERFRVLFDLGPIAVFSCNTGGIVQQYNRRAAELWGREPERGAAEEHYSASSKLHRPDGSLLPEAEDPIARTLQAGAVIKDVELLIERRDGSRVPVMAACAPLEEEAGSPTGAIIAFYDNSERKRLELELQKHLGELAAADKSKNYFLAMLAHELRSPLNAIRGWVEIIKREGTSDGKVAQGIDVIDRSSRAQADLIADLMDVHRLSSGKVRLEASGVEVVTLVSEAVEAVLPSAADKGIVIHQDLVAGPLSVIGDAHRLHQVLWNLLSNAIKFTRRGEEIRVELRRVGEQAVIRVIDAGEGIDRAALPHLFERFRQADPLTSRGHMGLGLGLAIAKQLVELHGGSIRGESPGKGLGATFTITLPLRSAEGAMRPQSVSDRLSEPTSASLGGHLVLVVDDEVDAREPLREALEAANAEVIAVASADEAQLAMEERRPDVLVSDIGMPGRDGYDLIRSIRALGRDRGGNVPAIALSAYASPEYRDRALQAGYDDYLAKPADPGRLIAAITALVARDADKRGEAAAAAPGP